LAARLKDTKIDKVYSSDLMRARQTAKIIFEGRPIEEMADLREMNFGIFERLKYEQLIEKYPELYRSWIDNPEKVITPNGEGLRGLSNRVEERLSAIICRNEGKRAAVVTHGGPIRIVLCKALKLDLKMFWQIEQQLCALNIIDYDEGSPPSVIKMNDTSYLSADEKVPL
jgi:broad specificity phosphatase PhoE